MDYIILGDLESDLFQYNRDEVEEIHMLDINELNDFMKHNKITPWFELIAKTKLKEYSKINRKELKNETNLKLINFCL